MANDLVSIGFRADTGELKQAQRELDNLSRSGTKTDATTQKLTRTIAGLGAAAAAAFSAGSLIREYRNFETGLLGVAKTTGLAGRELDNFAGRIDSLSRAIPVSTDELLELAQAAGQMGVTGSKNLELFSSTIAKLGRASDLAGAEAATALARILNVTGENISEIDTLASVIVRLGNSVAATESEIARMTTEVARATSVFGVTSTEAVGLASAMASIGIRAELGGSSVGRAMQEITNAVTSGGSALTDFAETLGINAQLLAETFQNDKIAAFELFLKGVAEQGLSAGSALESVGLGGQEIAKTIVPLANNMEIFARTMGLANDEAENATALNDEFEATLDSLESQLGKSLNIVKSLGRELSGPALAGFTSILKSANDLGRSDGAIENMADAATVLAVVVGGKLAGSLWSSTEALYTKTRASIAGAAAEKSAAAADLQKAASANTVAQADLRAAQAASARTPGFFLNTQAVAGLAAAEAAARAATDANTAAQVRYTAAARAASVATTTLNRAMSFLGGPAGILVGTVGAIWALNGSFDEGEKDVDDYASQIARLRGEMLEVEKVSLSKEIRELNKEFAELDKQIAEQQGVVNLAESASLNPEMYAGASAKLQEYLEKQGLVTEATIAAGLALEDVSASIDKKAESEEKAGKTTEAATKANLEVVSSLEQQIKMLGMSEREAFVYSEALRLSSEASDPLITKTKQLAGALFDSRREMERGNQEMTRKTRGDEAFMERTLEAFEAQDKLREGYREITRSLSEQRMQLEMTGREIFIYEQQSRLGTEATQEMRDAIAEQAGALYDQRKAIEDAAEAQSEGFETAWKRGIERVDDLFADLWQSAFSGFEDFGDALKRGFTGLLAELAQAAIARPIVLSITGGGALAASGQAAAGVGGAGQSIFSAISQGFTNINSGIQQSIAGLGVGLYDSLPGVGDFLISNAGLLSNIAPFAGAALSLLQGNTSGAIAQGIGAGIGTAIGGPIGGFIGSALGGVVGGLFGGDEQPRRSAATSNVSVVNGELQTDIGSLAGRTRFVESIGDAVSQGAAGFATQLSGLLAASGLNSDVRTSGFYTGRDGGSGYSDFEAQFAGGSIDFERRARGQFGEEDLQKFMGQLTGELLVEGIQKSSLPEDIKTLFDGLSDPTQVQQTVQYAMRLIAVQKQLADAYGLSADMSNDLVNQIGGADGYTSALSAFNSVFLSETEKASNSYQSLANLFAQQGASLPDNAEQYREIVEAQDLTTASGRELYAFMLQLGPAFKGTTDVLESAVNDLYQDILGREADTGGLAFYVEALGLGTATIEDISEALSGSAEALSQVSEEVEDLSQSVQDMLTEAGFTAQSISGLFSTVLQTAESAEQARMQGAAAAEAFIYQRISESILNSVSNIVMNSIVTPLAGNLLNASIGSASAIATGAASGASSIAQGGARAAAAMAAGGVSAGDRVSDAIAQVSDYLSLMRQVISSDEFKDAASGFADAIGDISGQLYNFEPVRSSNFRSPLVRDTEQIRQTQQDLTDYVGDYRRALQNEVSQLREAHSALEDALSVATDNYTSALETEIDAQESVIEEAQRMADAWGDLSSSIGAARRDIVGDISNTVDNLQAKFNEALQGVYAGNIESAERLPDLARDLAEAGANAAGSSFEMRRSTQILANQLSAAEIATGIRQSEQLSVVDAANAQLEQLQTQLDAIEGVESQIIDLDAARSEYEAAKMALDQSSLDEQLAYYENELNLLSDINENVMSLSAAFDALQNSSSAIDGLNGPGNFAQNTNVVQINANNDDLVTEMREMKTEMRTINAQTAENTKSMLNIFRRWQFDGLPEERSA